MTNYANSSKSLPRYNSGRLLVVNSAVQKLHLHPNVQLQPSRTFNHAKACNHIDTSLHNNPSATTSPASTTMELQHSSPKSKLTHSIRIIVWKHTGHSARRQHTKSPSVLHRQQSTSQARRGFPAFPSRPQHACRPLEGFSSCFPFSPKTPPL